jgi:magnesium transporter
MEDALLLTDTVMQLVREEAWDELRRLLDGFPPDDLADLLEHLDEEPREKIWNLLDPHAQGEVGTELDETVLEDLLEDVEPRQLAEIVSELDADEAVYLLEEADPETTSAALAHLDRQDPEDAELAGELRELLGYDEESAGRSMAFGAPAVRQEMTLGEAIGALREARDELDEVQTVFVVDAAGRLRGYLPLDLLLLQPPDTLVADVMCRDVEFVYTYEDQETIVQKAQRSGMLAIPVVDARGVLRGQITQGRIREIIEEETTEDVYRIVGLSEEESVFSSFAFSFKKRLTWLQINLVTAFVAAAVIERLQGVVLQVGALSWVLGIVAGEGGNAGVQSLTILVRGLALGEVDWRNTKRIFRKELLLGLLNGAVIGLTTAVVVGLMTRNFWLGVVAFCAMQGNIIAAALSGVLTPLILKKLKLDPAQSGVIASTVTDCCGFFLVLMVAKLLMPLILTQPH